MVGLHAPGPDERAIRYFGADPGVERCSAATRLGQRYAVPADSWDHHGCRCLPSDAGAPPKRSYRVVSAAVRSARWTPLGGAGLPSGAELRCDEAPAPGTDPSSDVRGQSGWTPASIRQWCESGTWPRATASCDL